MDTYGSLLLARTPTSVILHYERHYLKSSITKRIKIFENFRRRRKGKKLDMDTVNPRFGWLNTQWLRNRRVFKRKYRKQQSRARDTDTAAESETATKPRFQDLWVRFDNYSPRPWQEIEFGPDRTERPSSGGSSRQYHYYQVSEKSGRNSTSTAGSFLTVLLTVLSLWISNWHS